MRKKRLLIILYTYVVVLSMFTACTYDYFEDETNYLVFVPEVLDRTVSDCRIMVYDQAGTLVGTRYGTSPWEQDARMRIGQFCFRLPPGDYKVYCYTNTDSLSFVEPESLETSAFKLKENAFGVAGHAQPSDMFFQKLAPTIAQAGYLYTDTLRAERYTGRVTVRFKDFPGDISKIDKVQLLAESAPVMQYLKHDTLTSRLTSNDIMFHLDKLPQQQTANVLEVDHRYLPTVDDGQVMRLAFTFYDAAGGIVKSLPVEISERNTGVPLRLLKGKRLIVEVVQYTVTKFTLVGWNEDIESGNTDME